MIAIPPRTRSHGILIRLAVVAQPPQLGTDLPAVQSFFRLNKKHIVYYDIK
jgi:hypothetical protein